VILVSGVGAPGTAIAYAVRPTERRLVLIRPLSVASIFAALCNFSVGVATALKYAAGVGPAQGTSGMIAGLSESFVPPFVAFAFLAVAWLLVALGLRRQPRPPSRRGRSAARHRGQAAQGRGELLGVVGDVLQAAGEVVVVRLHVEVAVAAQVEQDDLRDALLAAAHGLVDRAAHRVVGLGRRHDPLRAGECDARLEAHRLRVGARLDDPELLQVV
jgi:hypothetical protein